MSNRVSGPRALLQSGLCPDGLTIVVLNDDREVTYIGEPAQYEATEEGRSFVLVSKNEEGAFAEVREALNDLAADTERYTELEHLDTLVQRGNLWWSAMCYSEECCPAAGKPIEDGREAVIAPKGDALVESVVADLAAGREPAKFDEAVNLIPSRDRLLAEADTHDLWQAIVTLTKHDESAQAWSVRACAYFAMGDPAAAEVSAHAAQAAGGTTLAELVLLGVRIGAPAELLLESIRAAS